MNRGMLGLNGTSAVIMSACLSILLGGYIVAKNLRLMADDWGRDLGVTIYLKSDADPSSMDELVRELRQDERVHDVVLVDRESVYKEFEDQMGLTEEKSVPDDEMISLIPNLIRIGTKQNLSLEARTAYATMLTNRLSGNTLVESIGDGQEWLRRYILAMRGFHFIVAFIAIALLMATSLIVSNVVRDSVERRRHEIGVLELVGAVPWQIRRPYLIQGVTIGAISSLIALMGTFGFYELVGWVMGERLGVEGWIEVVFLSPLEALSTVLASVTISGVASYLSVKRVNSGWAAARGAGS